MVDIYKTDNKVLSKLDNIEDGCWINMVNPTSSELSLVSGYFDIDADDLATALDEEESSRISLEDGYTLILVDIPTPEVRHEKKMYTTIPLGIILKNDAIITICREEKPVLVYFATSLRSNSIVLERLRRYKRLEQYPEDMELLEDVTVEYQQAIEMTTIYRDIIDGTRELLSSVINNRLNNVMKILTSITIVMAIPTIISGIYGMNVDGRWMPLSTTPYGFYIIVGIILVICIGVLWFLKKKKMM